jgi:hypothetical protein
LNALKSASVRRPADPGAVRFRCNPKILHNDASGGWSLRVTVGFQPVSARPIAQGAYSIP